VFRSTGEPRIQGGNLIVLNAGYWRHLRCGNQLLCSKGGVEKLPGE